MIRKFLLSLLSAGAVALIGIGTVAQADDIDIYVNPTASTSTDTPVVMFTLDFRSNLGSNTCQGGACSFLTTKTYKDASGVDQPYLTLSGGATSYFNLLRGSLKYVLQQVGSGTRIGLAMNHNNANNCVGPAANKCSNGGYILIGASALDTQAKRDAFYAKLDAIPVPQGNLAHSYQGKELFFELYRYFSSQAWYNMKNGWTDFGTSNATNIDQAADYTPNTGTTPLKWDTDTLDPLDLNKYKSPVTGACAKLYTINVMFSVSNQDSDSDAAIKSAAGGMDGINLQGANNDFKTVIRWMYDNDVQPNVGGKQNVVSYFIVDSTKNNTSTQGYAGAGLGLASAQPYELSSDPEKLIEVLSAIFKNILSTSTTFVAPSVAVNVYNRAQVLNDVYIAMFQAEENGLPTWPGNVKKFQIGINATSGDQEIRDAANIYAVADDGRIKYDALSFWTNPAALPAPPPPPATTDLVSGKDGRVVNRGGSGAKVPGFKLSCASATDQVCSHAFTPGMTNTASAVTNDESKRKLFTESSTGTSLIPLNADVSTAGDLQSALGASSIGTCAATDATSPPSACYLLKWARGLLNDGTTLRSWLMGDVLHSRPVAINYGGSPTPKVYIAAASNDGYMRLIRNTDGVEAWGFMPRAVMPKLATLAANNATSPVHPSLTDGAPAVYVLDDGGDGTISGATDKVYLYFGLRRGGTSYYALDITDPENPQLKWRIQKGAPGTDFAELGQTWSTPRVGKMLFNGATQAKPVVIFAGGYDTNKDTHPGHGAYAATGLGTDDSQGNSIFVVDAETGALIWKAVKGALGSGSAKVYAHPSLKDSIPSDTLAIDTDGNGLIDRIYVGDTGGVVWRADMASPNQADWILTPILSVGRHAPGNSGVLPADRRFFNAPDYAQSVDDTGAFDAVMIGAGDRENPKDLAVTNWFYMLRDRSVSTSAGAALSTSIINHGDMADITDYCVNGGACSAPPGMDKGWRLKLECPPSFAALCGEKNLSTAFTLAGTIYFTTYIPSGATTDACNLKEGNGLLYAVRLQDGTPAFSTGKGKKDRVTELDSSGIPAEVVSLGDGKLLQPDLKIRDTGSTSGFKSFWYKKPAK